MDEKLRRIQMFDSTDSSAYFSGTKHHFHKHTEGKTFQWFGTDCPENYNAASGYDEKHVRYDFNWDGYRCDPLEKSDVLALGCSYTFGTGIALTDTWSWLLAQQLRTPHINLAYQGGSFSYFERTLLKCLDTIQPKYVVLLYPYNWRFELHNGNGLFVWTASGVHSGLFTGKERERLYAYEQYRSKEQEEFEIIRSLRVIERMIRPAILIHTGWHYDTANTPSTWFSAESSKIGKKLTTSCFNGHTRHMEKHTKARDGMHPGRDAHHTFAHRVLSCISQKSTMNDTPTGSVF